MLSHARDALRTRSAARFGTRCGAGMLVAGLLGATVAQVAGTPGLLVENARLEHNGMRVAHGVFARNLVLDAVTVGDATFTREENRIHSGVDVRVSIDGGEEVRDEARSAVGDPDSTGTWRVLGDEEMASGSAPVRIVTARDLHPVPTTALDTIGGFSISTMLSTDGSSAVRIDVLFPLGVTDNAAGTSDRIPEVLVVGPIPSGAYTLTAILAGDIDDPSLASESAVITAETLDRSRSGVSILWAGGSGASPIAMLGFDLDDLGAHEGTAIGYRIKVPAGVSMTCKVFGLGDPSIQPLGNVDELLVNLGDVGGGFGKYGGGGRLRLPLPPLDFPSFPRGGPVSPDGGPRGPGPTVTTPPIPAPSAALVLIAGVLAASRQRALRRR
ncbi:MAG: hypothetical protein SGJ11_09765 [Phycisphaerae bacterium]|nr:hypothetical protein [Phycisphaerae bacterium]